MGKVFRLYGIGRVFESRGGIIAFYLFFTSFSKSFFIVLFATYSVNVNFRDYSYYVDRMNPLFPCDHGAASLPHTHSCIMHDTGRGTLCKNANGCREGTGEIQDCGDMTLWPDW